jgi:hypothetical protein
VTPHESDALTLVNVAGIVGGIAAFVGLWRYVAGVFRRTVGRRRDAYRRLARLGTGAQLAFFTSVLGEPPAIRQTITREEDVPQEFGSGKVDVRYVESFYVDRDYFVQTITNEDQTVEAFSVTSRSRRFRPTMWLPVRVRLRDRLFRRLPRGWRPLMIVKLGRTRFVDAAPDWTPSSVRAWVGARAWRYTEAYYFGNPGNYQTYVLVHSNAGAGVAADLKRRTTRGPGLSCGRFTSSGGVPP